MFTKIKHVAAIGGAVAGIGWLTAVSSPTAYAQPPLITPGNNITCSDTAGVNCQNDGSPPQQGYCPPDASANAPGDDPSMHSTRPECSPHTSGGKA
jgi:hypothetical protein